VRTSAVDDPARAILDYIFELVRKTIAEKMIGITINDVLTVQGFQEPEEMGIGEDPEIDIFEKGIVYTFAVELVEN
jgi:hypothetical protein